MRFRVLGAVEVLGASNDAALRRAKPRAILAMLLLDANTPVPAERLAAGVWGNRPPPSARSALQNYVSVVRRLVGNDLVTHPGGYMIRVHPDELDITRFGRLMHQAAASSLTDRSAYLREALDLWRGRPLSDCASSPFAEAEIPRLEELRLRALEERLDTDLALARHAEVVAELEGLVREHPFRERFRVLLMIALYRSGRQQDALAAYQHARRELNALGLEPGEDLRRLERAILRQDADVAAPWQRLSPTDDGKQRLPAIHDALIGRDQELDKVAELLATFRIVTITGAGGSGKTRLAIEVASNMEQASGVDVSWVPLGGLRDPDLVVPTIARALGLRASATSAIGDGERLLVLDNFEHLLAGVPGAAELLAASLNVRTLITSRAPLRIEGEHEYRLGPLDISASVKLFFERARQTGANGDVTRVVEEICRRLDRLPLAIELAAARARLLPLDELLTRLELRLPLLTLGRRDAPPRQRTLSATIEWSFDLLDDSSRDLLMRLAVFPGEFSFEAAEQVCLADVDALSALLDLNLVDRRGARFALLSTIRDFGLNRLGASLDELRARLARYVATIADDARARFWHGDSDALARVLAEPENARDALEWAVSNDRPLALDLLQDLGFALPEWGLAAETRPWLERIYRGDDPAEFRLRALQELVLATRYDDSQASRGYADEWVRVAREFGDAGAVANALTGVGIAALGDYGPDADADAACRALEDAVALARRSGEEGIAAIALSTLGAAQSFAGDYETALLTLESAAGELSRLDRVSSLAICIRQLAETEALRGCPSRAAASLVAAIELDRRIHSRGGLAICLDIGAYILVDTEPQLATQMLGAADEAVEDIGGFLRSPNGIADLAALKASEALGIRFDELRRGGRQLGQEQAIELALTAIAAL